MRLEIPFKYEVVYRLPRKRNNSSSWMRGSVPVEIREVSPEDMTIVMRYRHVGTHATHVSTEIAYPPAEFVEYEGETFRTAFLGYDQNEGPMIPEHLLTPVVTQGDSERLQDISGIYNIGYYDDDLVASEDLLGAKEVFVNTRLDVEEKIREKASRIIVSGNSVFVRSVEPVLKTVSTFDAKDGRRKPMLVPTIHAEEIAKEPHLRADRAEETAAARSEGRFADRFDRDFFMGMTPEVIRPDLLQYDDRAIKFRYTVGRMTTALKDMATLSQATASAFRKFTEADDALTKDPSAVERLAPMLVEAARSVRDLIHAQKSYVEIDEFIRIGEEDLLPRLKDGEAIAGRPVVFGHPVAARTVFMVPLSAGLDGEDIAGRLSRTGSVAARVGDGGLLVEVPENDWDKAEKIVSDAVEAVRNELHPDGAFSF